MPITRVRISGGIQTAPKRRKFCLSATKATAAMTAHSATPGATRRRLSGAHRRAISTATALLRIKDGDELAFAIASPWFTLISLIVPAFGDRTGISIFIDFEDHDLAFELDLVCPP